MANASLPTVTMTADEVAATLAHFGGEDAYLEWLRTVVVGRLESMAVAEAREQVNVQIRDAVEQKLADLPTALTEPVQA